jgi:alpha-glucosidase
MSDPDPGDIPWWQDAVFYQIYPLSFCLADPEGRAKRLGRSSEAAGDQGRWSGTGERRRRAAERAGGDLEGIRRHLDHLRWLGVDALWLSPTQPSPMADFGYDVADYRDIDPIFGTIEDFDRLVSDVHDAGMRLIIDLVPNHTSDRHPWFVDSHSSRQSSKRDWYYWRGGAPDVPPNNWRRAFGEGPAWTHDESSGEWYLHLFLPEQPDLNWGNPAVREEMAATLGWWLDRGVDGFRIDVVHALGKDPRLPDAPAGSDLPWAVVNEHSSTHDILREWRGLLDARSNEPVSVGEVFLLDTAKVATYYGAGDELHLAFNFPPMFCRFEAECFRRRIEEVERLMSGPGRWPTWVLSSHDRPRARTRYEGSEQRARAAAVLLLTLRGTPFLYAGEELGLEDGEPVPEPLDPGGRDGCRAPIPWDATPDHGWPLNGREPWLNWPPDAATRNLAVLRDEPGSILHLYRRLIDERKRSPALRRGSLRPLEGPAETIVYERRAGDDARLVVINFGPSAAQVPAAAGQRVLVASSSDQLSEVRDGAIPPESALVLTAP